MRGLGAAGAAFALVLAASASTAAAGAVWLAAVDLTDYDPLAVCQDGSSAMLYFKAATNPAYSNVWMLYLEGGDWCYDLNSCNSRYQNVPQYASSKKWQQYQKLGGIFEDNPVKTPFAEVNKAYLGYCTSDAYVGDASAFGYQFRGQRVVAAAIKALVQTHGMGARGLNERLLFGGCSAGARGAMFNADSVPDLVTAAGGANVQTQVMLDSSYWIDVQPYGDSLISLECQTQSIVTYVNATARLDAACAAANSGQEWKCLFGQYRMPYLRVPYALNEAQFDSFQIDSNMGWMNPESPSQVQYADAFQATMRSQLEGLPTLLQEGSGVFSSACLHHCVTNEAAFWGIQVEGVSFSDALRWWFFGGGPDKTLPPRLIESCTGYRCGTCSAKHSHKGGKHKPKPPKVMSWHWGMPPAPAAPKPAVCGGPEQLNVQAQG